MGRGVPDLDGLPECRSYRDIFPHSRIRSCGKLMQGS